MNVFLIVYGILLIGFILSVGAVTYHLMKYQFHLRNTFITTFLFLAGSLILLIINLTIAGQINWSYYRIIF